jgi:hypothetical protein
LFSLDVMSLDEFAAVTRRVIAREGFEEFQPTAVYTERDYIKGGADFPSDVPEAHILQWATEDRRNGEEMLVAFKIDDTRFKIVRHVGSFSEDDINAVATPKT